MDTTLKTIQLSKQYNFQNYLTRVLSSCESLSGGYHNFYHTCKVVGACAEIAKEEALLESLRADVSVNEALKVKSWMSWYNDELVANKQIGIRSLFIAALFHDFNHTKSAQPDSVNIQAAVRGWLQAAGSMKESASTIEEVEFLIKGTEYPYTTEPEEPVLKILRDADLCQIFTDNYFQQNVIDLAEEKGKGWISQLTTQYKFLSSLKPFTESGYRNYHSILEEKKTLLREICLLMGVTL